MEIQLLSLVHFASKISNSKVLSARQVFMFPTQQLFECFLEQNKRKPKNHSR